MSGEWKCPYGHWNDKYATVCKDPNCPSNRKSGRHWRCSWCHGWTDDNRQKCEHCGRDRKDVEER